MSYKNKESEGFTLIETAIVIMILSLIIVPLFKFMAQERERYGLVKEEEKLERITSALAIYVKANDRFPCPARLDLPVGNAAFGEEEGDGTGCNNAGGITLNSGVREGALPVQTLNLPYYMGYNQYGWKYSYAVTDAVTANNSAELSGVINVLEEDEATAVLGRPYRFVIIDHGKDGKGARSKTGAAGPVCNNSPLDEHNCDDDDEFVDADRRYLTNMYANDYYDDRLIYTFAREESTLWQVADSADPDAAMDIIPRMDTVIGVGTTAPTTNLEVSGGDLSIKDGALETTVDIDADGDISAGQASAGGKAISPVFYYGAP